MRDDLRTKTLAPLAIASLLVLTANLSRAEGAGAVEVEKCEQPVTFVQTDPVTLEWAQNAERRVEVVSSDGKYHKLNVMISDLGFKNANGESIPTAGVIEVTPQPVELKDGFLQILLRIVSTPDVKPGTYTGRILIEEAAANYVSALKNCWQSRPLQVVVPGITPLVDKMTVWLYRPFFTYDYECSDCVIPLRNPIASGLTPALQGGARLGGVVNTSGGTGAIYWTGESPTSPDGTPKLLFAIKDLKEAGKYEGKIVLDAAAGEKGAVGLTVNTTDCFIWPVLVIGLGILITTLTKIYFGVLRIRWRLREQEAALGVSFKESERRFAAAAGSNTYRTYSIADDFNSKRRELRASIDGLRPSSGMALDETDPNYKAVLATLATLKEKADNWGRFADELERLRLMLDQDIGLSPAPVLISQPKIISECNSLLSGKKLTLESFTALREGLPKITENARLWFRVNDRINGDRRLLAHVKENQAKLNQEQKGRLKTAEAALNDARIQLWMAETQDDLTSILTTGNPFSNTEQTIFSLASAVDAPAEEMGNMSAMSKAFHWKKAGPGLGYAMAGSLRAEPADDSARERFYARAINNWDFLLALLAFAIALLSGLNESYLGKPFGAFQDYVKLFLWGVGTKLLVDTVSVALGWLFNRAPLAGNLNRTRP